MAAKEAGAGFFDAHTDKTMLDQYKHVSSINDQKLKAARNIKDLVSIKITRMEPLGSDPHDLKRDPVSFRQQMPQMGDSSFMQTQAMLSGSKSAKAGIGRNRKH
jgi:hypothetical protein